ncbi:MAG: UDP-N-acetylmuramoyl-tripeptide--D-alanyl-D-alanine ligase [Candidatus Marinimicrobia bacterium]|nr:UDP-N-acetylmuramoyl-tripeptide--D-alanyl-D-alanine ligase [Candidatus Neomarinimicrobiota bacterium]
MKTTLLHRGPFTLRNVNAAEFKGISIDSRNIPEAHIFCALKGEHTDGHRFVSKALKNGAVAALVNKGYVKYAAVDEALIIVENTYQGLVDMASLYVKELSMPILAITGSVGKTSTRRLISHILRTKMTVAETPKNFNNHIGLPISILQMSGNEDIAVLEMGTSAIGEIRDLCKIVAPDFGMITSIAHAHIGGFGSIDNVQKAKYELFDAVKPEGMLFINNDDPRISNYPQDERKHITYGLENPADIRMNIHDIDKNACYRLSIDNMKIQLKSSGKGAALNAVAAYAFTLTMGMDSKKIISAIESYEPSTGRGKMEVWNGITLIDDTYNANPFSVKNAINALCAMKSERNKVMVLGDMLEMGVEARSSHESIGIAAAEAGISHLFCIGRDSQFTVSTAKKRGLAFAEHFETKIELAESLFFAIKPGDIVLFKGSRGVAVEEVISLIKDM